MRGDRVVPKVGSIGARMGLSLQKPLDFEKGSKTKVGGRMESTFWPIKIPATVWNHTGTFPKSNEGTLHLITQKYAECRSSLYWRFTVSGVYIVHFP